MSKTKKMKKTEIDYIELNVYEIEEEIKKNKKYEKKGILIKKWEEQENSNSRKLRKFASWLFCFLSCCNC